MEEVTDMNQVVSAAGTACMYLALCGVALAQPRLPYNPTDQEALLLPVECQAIRKGGPTAQAYSNRLQSQGIIGISHYCAGLNFVNRSKLALNSVEKRFDLQSAIDEFDYVLGHSAPNAVGLQKIRAMKEEAEMLLKLLPGSR